MRTSLLLVTVQTVLLLWRPLGLLADEREIKAFVSMMADNLVKASRKTVAVVDFTDLQGSVTELGRFLAEEVSVALSGTGKGLDVVDRTHLKALLQENKLAASGIIDPVTARKLGQIAGVDVLLTGTVTPFGDSVRCSVKALDTATARIITAFTMEVAKTKAIEELLNRGITTGASTGTISSGTEAGARPAERTVDLEQFQFTVRSCEREGELVACRVLVTNKRADRFVWVHGYHTPVSRVIDDAGNEYVAQDVRFGNGSPGTALVTGVPTLVTLTFGRSVAGTWARVPSSVVQISMLELQFAWADRDDPRANQLQYAGRHFSVQLRGIPLAR